MGEKKLNDFKASYALFLNTDTDIHLYTDV